MKHQPTPDQNIAPARQEIAARQASETEQAWSGASRWLWPAVALAAVLAFLAAPLPLPRKLLLAMGGVCALRPARSYFAGGVQLRMESPSTGAGAADLDAWLRN